ncbi:MAG: amidohydrolase [Anaerolineae bacterium]
MSHDFLPAAQALAEQLTAWRRDFHQHPELAFEETRTAGIVADHLAQLGLEVRTGVGQTGVVGLLEGGQPGRTVMLRFDMDALPIHEETGLPFASQVAGRMHACGHDGHTAIGLGVARLLAERQNELAGQVKFVFQPAEEIANGALAMLADGVMTDTPPDVVFGLHLWSLTPVGRAVVKPGPLWAAADRFTLEIVGRGSHGAMPHQGVDAIAVTAFALAQLQTVISRARDPLQPAVLTIGTISGGDAFNVLAERVQMTGTLRTFDPAERARLIERMQTVLGGVCAAHDATYRLTFLDYAPPVVNDAAAAGWLRMAAVAALGEQAVADGPMMMVSEDVAEFLDRAPGCFFVLGAMPEARPPEPHHSPRFDIDERSLPLGAAILAQTTADWLRAHA